MIDITGDAYGGFQRFAPDNFPQQKHMSRSDYMIITGDFGGVWGDSPRETYRLDWLEERPFTSSAQALYPSPRWASAPHATRSAGLARGPLDSAA